MLRLRELERGDLATINHWRSDRALIECLGAPYRFIGPEIDEAWFEAYLKSRSTTIRCVVVDDEDRKPLGMVTLAGIDWVYRCASLHLMIGEDCNRGKGVGTFALENMLRHAFADMGLHRVELEVLASNTVATHLYEKVGFVMEGTKRKAAFKSGSFEDIHLMSVLRDEWGARTHA